MRKGLIQFLATGLGVGWIPKVPGTMGAALGVLLWWGCFRGNTWVWWCYPVWIVVAIWLAGEAAKLMRDPDPGPVVIDEIVAMPIVLAGCAPMAWQMIVGFAAFRLFDIWKPFPIRQSQRLVGGMGIVVDDLLAAAYAWVLTQGIIWAYCSMAR